MYNNTFDPLQTSSKKYRILLYLHLWTCFLSMIFILYPSMIVKDTQRYSFLCGQIGIIEINRVPLQCFSILSGPWSLSEALLVFNRKWQSSENRMMFASIMSSREGIRRSQSESAHQFVAGKIHSDESSCGGSISRKILHSTSHKRLFRGWDRLA